MNWLNVVGPMSSAPCLIHGSLGPHESASGGITTCCPAANNAEYFDHRKACAHTNPPPNRLTISSVDFAQTRPGPVRNWLNVKGPTEPYTETAERPQGGHYHSRLGPGPRQQLDQPRDDRLRRLLQLRLRLMHPQRQSLNNTWQTRCLPLMGLLQLRYEHDSSTIRLRFDYDSATTRYEVFRALAYEIVYENQW